MIPVDAWPLVPLVDSYNKHRAERECIRKFLIVGKKDFAVCRLHDRIRPIIVP